MAGKICPNCGWENQKAAKFCAHCGAILTAPVVLKPGTTLNNGRYVIVRQLGKGGMGVTYLAKDTQAFDRLCVIKIMLPYFDPDDPQDFQAALHRFEQEAKALAELGAHPNIPNLLHWFEEGGQFFLVMEFIEGENLEDRLRREGIQLVEQVIKWGISLSKTLEFVASKGYVHHDIKPSNIILHAGSGEPILVDFGTVKAGRLAIKASFGTKGYAPPEQMMPPYQTEHRSDVFALAATLYHLLTGDHPAQDLWKFPKLPTIPQPLQDVLRQALNLDVRQRPTAEEFREMLEQCFRPQPITSPFVSKSGEKVGKPEDWLDFAERRWDEAAEHLQSGDVEVWLKSIGRFDLANKAEEARKRFPSDQNAALQTFLEALNPHQAPKPKLRVNPTELDFGYLSKGQAITHRLEVTNIGRGYLFGEIVTSESWIKVSHESVACLPGVSQTVEVTVDVNRLPSGENLQGTIIVRTNCGTLNVIIKVRGNLTKTVNGWTTSASAKTTNNWAILALWFALLPCLCCIPASWVISLYKSQESHVTNASQAYNKPALVWRFCWNCNGTGNKGACSSCDGRGYITCGSCEGHGVTPLGERCARCDGKGIRTCWMCEGKGIMICSTCDGTGKVWGYICSWCKGTGRGTEPCWWCNGRGYKKCYSCLGKGLCWSCDGRGYSLFSGIVCYRCKGSGRCDECFGNGWKICDICKGTGLEECSGCDGKGIILRR